MDPPQSCPNRTRAHPGPEAPATSSPKLCTGSGDSCLPWRPPPCSGGSSSQWGPLGLCRPCSGTIPLGPARQPGRRNTGQHPRTPELPQPPPTAAVPSHPSGESSVFCQPYVCPRRARVPSTPLVLCSRTWPSHPCLSPLSWQTQVAVPASGHTLAAPGLRGSTCPLPTMSMLGPPSA